MAEARRTFRGWMRVVVVLAAVACATFSARAQTQLPGITVTTPSPVTPSTAPAQAPAASPQPAPDLAGTGLQIAPDQSFVATTVVTPQQLLSQPSAALGDALAARPGIAATTFAPGASRPVIRGLSGFRGMMQQTHLTNEIKHLAQSFGAANKSR